MDLGEGGGAGEEGGGWVRDGWAGGWVGAFGDGDARMDKWVSKRLGETRGVGVIAKIVRNQSSNNSAA